MLDLDLSFEPMPWEALTAAARDKISAAALLSVTEEASEEEFDDILEDLRSRHVLPSLEELPKTGNLGEAAVRLRQEEVWAAEGLQIDGMPQGDPLRLSLEEIAAVPAFGDTDLFAQQAAAGDENARAALVNLSLSRVVELSCGYVGRNVLLSDLIQEGSLGLWQAVQQYSGGDFEEYRDWNIHFYLIAAVLRQARENGVGQKMRTALEDYTVTNERLLGELGRHPTLEELADAMHIDPEAAAMVAKLYADARRLHQIRPMEEPEQDPEEDQAVEDTAYFQMRQRITELLSILNEEDAKLLTLRFGLDSGLPKSAEETGKIMGLTPDEVTQREAAALSKLRNDR